MTKHFWIGAAMAVLTGTSSACDLKVDSAWIREAPPTATALAGYAVLSNAGSKPLSIAGTQSPAFASVELHESLTENGVAKMRSIQKLEIKPGAKVEFAPGGKHFMLISPTTALTGGATVSILIKDSTGCETKADFKVGAPAAHGHDHLSMDQSKMDHSNMKHE